MNTSKSIDQKTADAFAESWNHLPEGSVYTYEQFVDWIAPLSKEDVEGKSVLELGCGNASLLYHMATWKPAELIGVDLGDSVLSAEKNMNKLDRQNIGNVNWHIEKADLTEYMGHGADITYCIGVLHHLKDPYKGFHSLVKNTKSGGQFHAWVYAHEGNFIIRVIVDPIRKIASKLPWWFTKYVLATGLVAPYYVYAKVLSFLPQSGFLKKFPLYEYSLWIAKRGFLFFRHVAFDQLVTPQTAYIKKYDIEDWFARRSDIDKESIYIIRRNGNSWKFGGKKV